MYPEMFNDFFIETVLNFLSFNYGVLNISLRGSWALWRVTQRLSMPNCTEKHLKRHWKQSKIGTEAQASRGPHTQTPQTTTGLCPGLGFHSLHLCLYSCPAPKFIRTIFVTFQIYVLAYSICFLLSDLLHSVRQTLGPSTSLQITQFRFF